MKQVILVILLFDYQNNLKLLMKQVILVILSFDYQNTIIVVHGMELMEDYQGLNVKDPKNLTQF